MRTPIVNSKTVWMDCLSTLQVVLVMCIVSVHLTVAYNYYRSPYTESFRHDGRTGRRSSFSRNPPQLSRNNPLFNIQGFPKRQDMCSVNGPSDIRRLLPGRFMSESELLSIVPNSFNKNEHKPTYTSLKRIVVSRFTESGFSKPGTAQYINDGICGCCVTELSYEIMTEITDFNGQNHTIINFNNSYQFIPAGKCSNENAPCAGGTARCKQVTRAHWSLVWTPSVGARLVAHEVPSHCQCINLGAAASAP
ncbi:hypothetical protein LOTGIDRAFT_235036 [Lottia gigantea]|uniref:Spaetzle domain-containing protein n=1 Tax=Lottia gigantea TaxID=225164 RepID=V3ZY54_LOTGI|nr:hypothetical protein LOTGIDRAFT_235036 [Lottia gigantea]ESO87570.1 hypothetical protein LOTGIDRAFT_235036 [Lottia gigantea]